MATKETVICVFSANNILPSCHSIRSFNSSCNLVICADRDLKPGKPEHKIGERKARFAASRLSNCIVKVVSFTPDSPESWSDFNDLHCYESLEAVSNQLKIDPSAFVEIIKLGYLGKKYFYFNTQSLKMESLTPTEHNKNQYLAMANHKYWGDHYAYKKDKEGNQTVYADFEAVTEKIFEEQRAKGFFKYDNIRGYGTNKDDKEIIVNLGDSLFHKGHKVSIFSNTIKSKYFYEANKAIDINFKSELTEKEGQSIVETFQKLNYKNERDYVYLCGWLALSQVFGALDWRPHIWITGVKGSGKTTILKWIHDMIPFSIAVKDSTAAGIKQEIKNNSMAVIYDEAEPNDEIGKKRMAQVIELARQCSSLTDSRVLRGTIHGDAICYRTNAIFLFGSIQKFLPTTADVSRFFPVEMIASRNQQAQEFTNIQLEMEKIATDSNKIFTRMVNRFDQLQENIKVAVKTIKAEGNDARPADQLAAIIAGYYTLQYDSPMTENHVLGLMELIEYNTSEYKESSEMEESELCLDTILDLIPIGRHVTIGQTVDESRRSCNPFHEKDLESVGIRFNKRDNIIFVSSMNIQLKKLLRDTIYSDYVTLLKRHKNFIKYGLSRIAGSPRKGMFIKLEGE